MADDDEVDILGDFNLENLLTKDENRLASCYDGGVGSDLLQCDYQSSWYCDVGSPPWYERSQLDSFSPLPFSMPPSSSPNNLHWSDPSSGSGSSSNNSANWTDKERSLLEEGLELFGRSWSRLAQYIGTKTAHQIKSYVKFVRPTSESETLSVSISSSIDGNVSIPAASSSENNISYTELIDDLQIPASMEEVIAVVSTAQPTISSNHNSSNRLCETIGKKLKKRKAKPSQTTKAKRGRPPRISPQKPILKRGRGRPRKLLGGSTFDHGAEKAANINVISELTETPRLGEEVVRIRSLSSSDDSDVEIEIEDYDDDVKTNSEDFLQSNEVLIEAGSSITVKEEDSNTDIEPPCMSADGNDMMIEGKYQSVAETPIKMENLETKTLISHQDILDQIHQLPPPTHERILMPDEILDEERAIHAEFFEGRPAKTPRRYLKIRNHIIDSWTQSKPNYVTKTSVRSGLRNCGDVNCIGRIHSYLEQTGVINFGCEQTKYYHAPPPLVSLNNKVPSATSLKEKVNRELLCIEGMRPRKKKQEIDEDLLGSTDGGYTILHKEDGQTFLTYNTISKPKSQKLDSSIKLLYCSKFSSEKPAPFTVHLHIGALLVIDVHSHASHDVEVMGLLGGELREDSLHIVRAVSCQASLSSSTHCDMCPVSQSEASDTISREGLSVVGWYHSHPTFVPNPSLQDLSTQAEMQRWFSDTKAAPFVGLILSPYCTNTTSFASIFRVLIVDPEGESGGTPYRFPVNVVAEDVDVGELLGHVDGTLVSMRKPTLSGLPYTHSPDVPPLNCFRKCMESIHKHMESCQPSLRLDMQRQVLEGIQEICKIRCSVEALPF